MKDDAALMCTGWQRLSRELLSDIRRPSHIPYSDVDRALSSYHCISAMHNGWPVQLSCYSRRATHSIWLQYQAQTVLD